MSLDCRSLAGRLEQLLEGTLSADARRAADEHLEHCASCRDLVELMRTEPAELAGDPPTDLVGGVLARTSGSACGAAREQLCDVADDGLPRDDLDLVRLHLDACPDCETLLHTLVRLSHDLPLLAEVQPDAAFVGDVLARTSRRKTWAVRLTEAWDRLLARPRLALEGAYLGAMLGVLVFGVSNEPLAGVQRALDSVRAVPSIDAQEPARRIQNAWLQVEKSLDRSTKVMIDDVARLSLATIESIRAGVGTLRGDGASEQETDTTGSPDGDDTNRGDER